MASPPTPEQRIRLTITVTPDVHEIFSRMAEASGVSLGRAMGDWLADTAEGAQFVALKMEEARRAPKTVMREFHSYAKGLVDQVEEVQTMLRKGGGGEVGGAGHATPDRVGLRRPPSSNTGGKVPRANPKKGAA